MTLETSKGMTKKAGSKYSPIKGTDLNTKMEYE